MTLPNGRPRHPMPGYRSRRPLKWKIGAARFRTAYSQLYLDMAGASLSSDLVLKLQQKRIATSGQGHAAPTPKRATGTQRGCG
ncbi:hypothetical protein SAY87_002175 [Trapa incisa]|uniref:Uncharacterized protein n=1 Tax=Trapa incisa TaxID=236973 RepID=A0AAN7JTT7_9MYRT|nr:hypothetical protein SAY87_002175 [Trapa incisa]